MRFEYFCETLTPPQNTSNNPIDDSSKRCIEIGSEHSDSLKQSNPSSPWLIVWAGISITLPILLLYIYSCKPEAFSFAGVELKQILGNQDIDAMLATLDEPETPINTTQTASISNTANSSIAQDSTLPFLYHTGGVFTFPAYELPVFADTTKHRIILIGDSESGGLRYPLNDYCLANGHKLVLSVEWYSATVFNFGRSDTIDKIIARFKPTYIFLVFGLNELYARDLKARKIAANLLAKKLRNIPYAWIGPANWDEDYGINRVFKSSADSGSFFLTRNLTLTRAGDGRHPDIQGYRIWMDSVANWLQTSAKYKMAMKPPRKRGRPFRSSIITLNAAKYRGY